MNLLANAVRLGFLGGVLAPWDVFLRPICFDLAVDPEAKWYGFPPLPSNRKFTGNDDYKKFKGV